ncbi:MAG: beta-lactamase family protein [Polyangiaceae bacterium]|nr:beta-lactamase family protein [Polyangiaceae bacterium]
MTLAQTPFELAQSLVLAHVAPTVAVGWAVRRAGHAWESRSAEAIDRSGGGGTPIDFGQGGAIFDLASLTKPMTAFAAAHSDCHRTDVLGSFLATARGTPSESVSLELLLAHRAGLEAHAPLYLPLTQGKEVKRHRALVQAASARRADAVGLPPPDGFAPVYSDLGYLLVGEALAQKERARDAGEIIEARVVAPLKLRDELGTARALDARGIGFAERVVPTEIVPWRGGEVRGRVHDENAWALGNRGGEGHAGMFGTVGAVLAFGCAALDAVVHGQGPLSAGDLGWLVTERPGGTLRAGFDGKSECDSSAGKRAGQRAFGHLGFTGTSLWIDPDAGAVVVVLTNRVYYTRENTRIRAARPAAHDALFAMAANAQAQ